MTIAMFVLITLIGVACRIVWTNRSTPALVPVESPRSRRNRRAYGARRR